MYRSNIISEIYGFSACLVALIIFIASCPGLIQHAADYIDPGKASDLPDVMTQSFEKWKIDFVRSCYFQEVDHDSRYRLMVPVPDDTKLHTLYIDEIAKESQRHAHSVSILFWEKIAYVLLSVVIFLFHWRWLRRQSSAFDMHAR